MERKISRQGEKGDRKEEKMVDRKEGKERQELIGMVRGLRERGKGRAGGRKRNTLRGEERMRGGRREERSLR